MSPLQSSTRTKNNLKLTPATHTRGNPMQPKQIQKSEYIIRLRQVIDKTGLSRSTIYNLLAVGDFPARINLSQRTMGFLESEVDDWIAERIAASKTGE